MLQVSGGALASLILLLVICFVLPIGLFTLLYRVADGKIKTLGLGAAAYFVAGFVFDVFLLIVIRQFTDMTTNTAMYMVYSLVLMPLIFIVINYWIMNHLGKGKLLETTGDSLMYSVGYTSLQNVITTGFLAVVYFLSLMDIKSSGGRYVVISDSDFVSYSDTVSASNLINESVYRQMQELCGRSASYFLSLCLDRLWIIVAYAAVLLVLWLAVRKAEKLPLLGFALVMRLLAGLPMIISDFGLIKNTWLAGGVSAGIAVVLWIAAVFCWRAFIDSEDAPIKG